MNVYITCMNNFLISNFLFFFWIYLKNFQVYILAVAFPKEKQFYNIYFLGHNLLFSCFH